MKIRNGFVSNSSSSSFIILGDDSFVPKSIDRVELNDEQKERLLKAGKIDSIDGKVSLTEFVSDSMDEHYDILYLNEDEDIERDNVKEYEDGGHMGPYDDDYYDEISDNVYLLKEEYHENKKWIR